MVGLPLSPGGVPTKGTDPRCPELIAEGERNHCLKSVHKVREPHLAPGQIWFVCMASQETTSGSQLQGTGIYCTKQSYYIELTSSDLAMRAIARGIIYSYLAIARCVLCDSSVALNNDHEDGTSVYKAESSH